VKSIITFVVVILTIGFLRAQNEPKSPEAKKPPTPKERAREIADKAIDTITGSQPDTQVAGLLHLAEIYTDFDKTRALELFRQAFSAASSLPADEHQDKRGYMMAQVASVTAESDVDLAIELLGQMDAPQSGRTDHRGRAVEAITRQLIGKKQLGRAAELVISLGSQGDFEYEAAAELMKAAPEGDPLKMQLFSAATTAYNLRPKGEYPRLVAQHWRSVPQPMAENALSAILNAILDKNDKNKDKNENYVKTISSAKGAITLSSRENAELFNLLHVIRAINPKKAEELVESRLELKSALERFPEGEESMRTDGGMNISTTSGGAPNASAAADMQLQSLSNARYSEAMSLLSKDPDRAIALIREIPLKDQRARALAAVANHSSEKDASAAKSALAQALHLLDDIKDPGNTVDAYVAIAEAAHKIKDEESARLALDRALTGATQLYKQDSNSEAPNMAPREYWPSTQSYRRIIYRATAMYGPDAEYVLPKIADPDLNLLASIEMARSLLNKPSRSGDTMVSRTTK
jgi:hypothetical protein